MLDFGSRMPAVPEHDEEDLFSAIPEEEKTPLDTGEEIIPEEKFPDTEENTVEDISEYIEEKKTPVPPAPVPAKSVPFFRGSSKVDSKADREKLDAAEVLKAARLRAGLTPEDVENETQIRVRFLMALEEGYFDDLPQQVYVLAYLRKLCKLYKISKEDEDELVRPWRCVPREVPENLPASVIPDENSENRKILHRMEVFLLALIAIVVIGVVVFLVILGVSFFNRDKVDNHFDTSSLLELQEKPVLKAPRMAPAGR